jgi:hypothetical protein
MGFACTPCTSNTTFLIYCPMSKRVRLHGDDGIDSACHTDAVTIRDTASKRVCTDVEEALSTLNTLYHNARARVQRMSDKMRAILNARHGDIIRRTNGCMPYSLLEEACVAVAQAATSKGGGECDAVETYARVSTAAKSTAWVCLTGIAVYSAPWTIGKLPGRCCVFASNEQDIRVILAAEHRAGGHGVMAGIVRVLRARRFAPVAVEMAWDTHRYGNVLSERVDKEALKIFDAKLPILGATIAQWCLDHDDQVCDAATAPEEEPAKNADSRLVHVIHSHASDISSECSSGDERPCVLPVRVSVYTTVHTAALAAWYTAQLSTSFVWHPWAYVDVYVTLSATVPVPGADTFAPADGCRILRCEYKIKSTSLLHADDMRRLLDTAYGSSILQNAACYLLRCRDNQLAAVEQPDPSPSGRDHADIPEHGGERARTLIMPVSVVCTAVPAWFDIMLQEASCGALDTMITYFSCQEVWQTALPAEQASVAYAYIHVVYEDTVAALVHREAAETRAAQSEWLAGCRAMTRHDIEGTETRVMPAFGIRITGQGGAGVVDWADKIVKSRLQRRILHRAARKQAMDNPHMYNARTKTVRVFAVCYT